MVIITNFTSRIRKAVKRNLRLLTISDIEEIEDGEYHEYISEITGNEEFQRLKEFDHHDASIFHHAVKVSYISYVICRVLKIDRRAAARGGLLHDFFLYDWRDRKRNNHPGEKRHAAAHPHIALSNAEKHFDLSDKEKDIIVKHMWPATIPIPRYRESYVILLVDKIVAAYELYLMPFRKLGYR